MARTIKTVLVVDDSRLARIALSKQLKKRELDVDMAGDGGEALAKLGDAQPDLVFMDFMMPDMDGFEAVRRLRELPGCAELPVVMYTSQDTPEDRAKGAGLGVIGFLIKPSSEDRLDEILQRVAEDSPEAAPEVATPAAATAAVPPEAAAPPPPAASSEPVTQTEAPAPAAVEIPWDDIRRIAREAAEQSAGEQVAAARSGWDEMSTRITKQARNDAEQAVREVAQPLAEKVAGQLLEERLGALREELRRSWGADIEEGSRAAAEAVAAQLRAEQQPGVDEQQLEQRVSALIQEQALPQLQQPVVEMTRTVARETAAEAARETLTGLREELEQSVREAATEAARQAAREEAAEVSSAQPAPARGGGLIAGAIVVAGVLVAAAVFLAL